MRNKKKEEEEGLNM